ncbi:hypothetical protein [Acrocarpospora sp. B8E8]|uniref:hypothetical protein n=1 Tax=Acrocarpospora sp. B8E8 TaxID=3153572 RepID=UPI00325E3D12
MSGLLNFRQRFTGDGDQTGGRARVLVINDPQPERLKQTSQDRLGELGQVGRPDREQLQQFRALTHRLGQVQSAQLRILLLQLRSQLARTHLNVAHQFAGGIVGQFQTAHQPGAADLDVLDAAGQGGQPRLAVGFVLKLHRVQRGAQIADAGGVEDIAREEAIDPRQQVVLAYVDGGRVSLGAVPASGDAGVVGVAFAGLAEHPPLASRAEDIGAQRVGAAGSRARAASCGAGA